jgi:hypothetical protein
MFFRALADGWTRKGLVTGWFFFVLLSALLLVLPFSFMIDSALANGSLGAEKLDPIPLSTILELAQLHPVGFSSAMNMSLLILTLFAVAHSLFAAGMFGSVHGGRRSAAHFFSDLAKYGPRFLLLGSVAFLVSLAVLGLGILLIALFTRLIFGEDPSGAIAFRLIWLRAAWVFCCLVGWIALRDLMRWSLILQEKGLRRAVGQGLRIGLRRGLSFWFLCLLFYVAAVALMTAFSFARFNLAFVVLGSILTLVAIWLRGWLLVSLIHAERQFFLALLPATVQPDPAGQSVDSETEGAKSWQNSQAEVLAGDGSSKDNSEGEQTP